MWQTAYNYFSESKILQECLKALKSNNNDNRWNKYDALRHLSIPNANGISISFYYGYSELNAEIADESLNYILDKRSKIYRKLKKEGFIRLRVNVDHTLYYPEYPPSCLKRLLEILKREFGGFEIEDKEIILIKTNNSENIIDSYLKLCDILYRERIKCHNDIKKYLYKNGILYSHDKYEKCSPHFTKKKDW